MYSLPSLEHDLQNKHRQLFLPDDGNGECISPSAFVDRDDNHNNNGEASYINHARGETCYSGNDVGLTDLLGIIDKDSHEHGL